MWLSKPTYELLPYALLVCSGLLAAAAYAITPGWLQTLLIVAGCIAAVGGAVLLLKRRDYRLSRSRVKYDRLD